MENVKSVAVTTNILFPHRKHINVSELPYEDWVALRFDGVGGSDVASIFGLSAFRSRLAIFWDKVSRSNNTEMNDAIEWGRRLEPVVVQKFQDNHPDWNVVEYPYMVIGENEWEFANVDALVEIDGEWCLVEAKTTDVSNKAMWKDESAPEYYILQVQWYMGILGIKRTFFCCLIGGNTYVEQEVHYDHELFLSLQKGVESFWKNYVLTQTPPPVESHVDNSVVGAVYRNVTNTENIIDLSNMAMVLEELEKTNSIHQISKSSYKRNLHSCSERNHYR